MGMIHLKLKIKESQNLIKKAGNNNLRVNIEKIWKLIISSNPQVTWQQYVSLLGNKHISDLKKKLSKAIFIMSELRMLMNRPIF